MTNFRDHAIGLSSRDDIRVVLYSHDSLGLGHLRRNLSIATALVEGRPRVQTLLITGTGYANAFRIPDGVDIMSLPSWTKVDAGKYEPSRLRMDGADLSMLRSSAIMTAVRCFEPDLFVVDKVPRGVRAELDRVLVYLRTQKATTVILGLRDILDLPERVQAEWEREGYRDVINEFYDAIWIYGDEKVYDPIREYGWTPEIGGKALFTGYIDRAKQAETSLGSAKELLQSEKLSDGYTLCVVGGGADGFALAMSAAEADPGPRGMLILTGPFMPSDQFERLRDIARTKPNLRITRFCNEPVELARRSGRVICMGGYNTLLELVGLGIRPLVVPRVKPRAEQLIRASRFAELGLADVLHPGDLSGSALSEWLHRDVPIRSDGVALDINGLTRIVDAVTSIADNRTFMSATGGTYGIG